MDYLSRIKSTVVDTMSNISSVLTGNPLSGQYEVGKFVGSYGPGHLWSMYHAIKRSTREEACVFLLEKKSLERFPKNARDAVLAHLKEGVAQLTRLRHPSILTVSHPLEESREAIAFATEACFSCLSNILQTDEASENQSKELPQDVKEYSLQDVEIKYGLSQIAAGLTFLHQAKKVHGNLCPQNIVINKKGAWKLAGFDLCLTLTGSNGACNYDVSSPTICQPHYDYLAPECVLDLQCSAASDMYSLGVLVYAVHSSGETLYSSKSNMQSLRKYFEQIDSIIKRKVMKLPQGLRDHVKLLLSSRAELRPDAFEFEKLPFLEDPRVKTLKDLDSLYQLDKVAKSHVYKGLPPMIEKLPNRMKLYRVLPCLACEFMNPEMVPFVLPSVLLIVECSTEEEFATLILPDMKKIFTYSSPVHIMYLLLQRMDLLIGRCPPDAVRDCLLPMVYRALECNSQQIQELCLTTIPTFAQSMEYGSMKNHLLPKVKSLCVKTSLTPTRVRALVCLGKLLEHLDKWVVLDDIIAWLPEVKSRDSAVIMAMMGIYKVALSHQKLGITKEILACKVIPTVAPLLIEGSLSLNQFNQSMSLIKEMLSQVENEHRSKLEQTDTGESPDGSSALGWGDDAKTPYLDVSVFDEGKNGPTGKLSLEQKQKILKQDESLKLFGHGEQLKPTTRAEEPKKIAKADHKPKDLTASLLNANLSSFDNDSKLRSNQDSRKANYNRGSFTPSFESSLHKQEPANLTPKSTPTMDSSWDDGWGTWTVEPKNDRQIDLSEFDTLK